MLAILYRNTYRINCVAVLLYSAMRRIMERNGMTNFISLSSTGTDDTYTLLVAQSGIYHCQLHNIYVTVATSIKYVGIYMHI